jgi:hypothetical protein
MKSGKKINFKNKRKLRGLISSLMFAFMFLIFFKVGLPTPGTIQLNKEQKQELIKFVGSYKEIEKELPTDVKNFKLILLVCQNESSFSFN